MFCPLTVSDTLTLNWYYCPFCSPDATLEEALSWKVTVPVTAYLLLLPLYPLYCSVQCSDPPLTGSLVVTLTDVLLKESIDTTLI